MCRVPAHIHPRPSSPLVAGSTSRAGHKRPLDDDGVPSAYPLSEAGAFPAHPKRLKVFPQPPNGCARMLPMDVDSLPAYSATMKHVYREFVYDCAHDDYSGLFPDPLELWAMWQYDCPMV
jgi:hypothetical protein